jgi:hypothetical protein
MSAVQKWSSMLMTRMPGIFAIRGVLRPSPVARQPTNTVAEPTRSRGNLRDVAYVVGR